ncbi:MAG: hypothetical protein HC773_02170 [Scytonema sp. CRU_2_7]|nr:hypothetical protein [Scytonema sp. CRU_2_7]
MNTNKTGSITSIIEKCLPYYEKLSLSEKPKTIDEFAAKLLPQCKSDHLEYAEHRAVYEQPLQHHTYLDKYRSLLQQPSPHHSKND